MSSNKIPSWVESIRTGDFQGAENSLIEAGYQKLTAVSVNAEVARITETAGPYAKYVAAEAQAKTAQRINAALQQGVQVTPQAVIDTYNHQLQSELTVRG